ncbi:hypothetical protein MSHOH_1470 [Methanosarcina horonobensis HB-1 = JCM 15518]|uniref:Uncharacterized protein n=1 Tax=Methanosarcina horonobensis HB-1 = JCM 15518 TaxID=1434110 RepID=A0A0E3SEL5_9EURY|nr:hypothetical protein [Methanosarcina horonobensis]AKB77953.1 hypothetical protein MSHOH_1470 [Methanosarcina horonobensis HB-1 = JCM 15518]
MRLNNIIKFNLETRTKELKDQGKTLDEISEILSVESEQKITKSTVFRYFEAKDREAAQVIEKQDKLKARVVEAEISTIEYRMRGIEVLLNIAENGEHEHNRVKASLALKDSLDSLDSRLGKLSPTKNTQNNFFVNAPGAEPAKLRDRMKVYDAIFEEADES